MHATETFHDECAWVVQLPLTSSSVEFVDMRVLCLFITCGGHAACSLSRKLAVLLELLLKLIDGFIHAGMQHSL